MKKRLHCSHCLKEVEFAMDDDLACAMFMFTCAECREKINEKTFKELVRSAVRRTSPKKDPLVEDDAQPSAVCPPEILTEGQEPEKPVLPPGLDLTEEVAYGIHNQTCPTCGKSMQHNGNKAFPLWKCECGIQLPVPLPAREYAKASVSRLIGTIVYWKRMGACEHGLPWSEDCEKCNAKTDKVAKLCRDAFTDGEGVFVLGLKLYKADRRLEHYRDVIADLIEQRNVLQEKLRRAEEII